MGLKPVKYDHMYTITYGDMKGKLFSSSNNAPLKCCQNGFFEK